MRPDMNYEKYSGLAQALFEESRDAIFLLDTTAEIILDANGAAQRLTGFSLRELIGASVANMFRCNDEPGLHALPEHTRRVQHFYAQRHYWLRCFQRDGWLPVDVAMTKLVVQPHSLALVTVQNARISAAHRAWDTRQLRRLMCDYAVCLWRGQIKETGEVEFEYFTPVIKHLSGRPAKYFDKGLESWNSIIHADDRSHWQATWERIWTGVSAESEYRIIWPDGSIRWLRESVQADRHMITNTIKLCGITSNITPLRNRVDSQMPQGALVGH